MSVIFPGLTLSLSLSRRRTSALRFQRCAEALRFRLRLQLLPLKSSLFRCDGVSPPAPVRSHLLDVFRSRSKPDRCRGLSTDYATADSQSAVEGRRFRRRAAVRIPAPQPRSAGLFRITGVCCKRILCVIGKSGRRAHVERRALAEHRESSAESSYAWDWTTCSKVAGSLGMQASERLCPR